jgi:proteasome-associated ATPase
MSTIVDRSNKVGIKSVLKTGQPGLRVRHLLDAIVDEFAENEDLPNTGAPPGSSPDDQLGAS